MLHLMHILLRECAITNILSLNLMQLSYLFCVHVNFFLGGGEEESLDLYSPPVVLSKSSEWSKRDGKTAFHFKPFVCQWRILSCRFL